MIMSFNYTVREDGDNVLLDMRFYPGCSSDLRLDYTHFSEVLLYPDEKTDNVKIKISKEKIPEDNQLRIKVNNDFYTISLKPEKLKKIRKERTSKALRMKEEVDIRGFDKCPECGSINIIQDYGRFTAGEIFCGDCGYVIGREIDYGPEWRAFDEDQRERRTRVGAPVLLSIHDKGLTTMIDPRDIDYFGKKLDEEKKELFFRLRKWQNRIRISDAGERTMSHALSDIRRISEVTTSSKSIVEDASLIFRKASKKGVVRGRSIEGVVAASVYLAKRKRGIPVTLHDIAKETTKREYGEKQMRKVIARNVRELHKRGIVKSVKVPKSEDYVTFFTERLSIRNRKFVEEASIKTLRKMRENIKLKKLLFRDPRSPAAALIYIYDKLSGGYLTQREIAEVAGLTEVTIRSRYKEFLKNLEITLLI
jgi:transcription initiation factor TFIIB